MSLFAKLLHAVQSWRRRRDGHRTTQLSSVAVEYLDHRQLLAVAFTGNVPIDFPASMSPGVVVLTNNPAVTHPVIAPDLAPIVRVSGFDISGIRATYTPADDTLSIGIEQPPSGQPGRPRAVIAGDADNNGDSGTVNPDVLALRPAFRDFPDLGSSETIAAFLDLRNTGYADVVAGFAFDDPRTPKPYQVARAIVNTNAPPTEPDFGMPLPANTGNFYLVNSSDHPNVEFTISNFSQLYQSITGQALTAESRFSIGAFGGSADDIGISSAFFPQQSVRLGDLTPPTPVPPIPPICPPVSPNVLINPHENRHVNTAHPTNVRVSVLGSSGFDATGIDPATVRLGGATPISSFTKRVNRDEFEDATFVFRGNDIQLPPGINNAEVTGSTRDGKSFATSTRVFNRDDSSYSPDAVRRQGVHSSGPAARFSRPAREAPIARVSIPVRAAKSPVVARHQNATSGPVVKIKRREPAIAGARRGSNVSHDLQASMNRFLQDDMAHAGRVQSVASSS